jgi:hypothetical protein
MKLSYEQPSLKKYGTMKEFTQKTKGSGSDGMGGNDKGASNYNDPPINNAGGIDIGEEPNANAGGGLSGTFDPTIPDK